jgi:hypothetical protein
VSNRPLPPSQLPPAPLEDDELLEDRGRSMGLRLLALLGALSFVMLGISSIAPLLQPPPPPERPGERQAPQAVRRQPWWWLAT